MWAGAPDRTGFAKIKSNARGSTVIAYRALLDVSRELLPPGSAGVAVVPPER